MFILCASLGLEAITGLAWFVVTVLLALATHMFVVLPLWVKFVGNMSLLTSSAAARRPSSRRSPRHRRRPRCRSPLRVAEDELKLPRKVSRFVLTVGASANHHGTALFEGITVLFLAQVAGLDLSFGQQLLVLGLCILGGIGTAGIPSGSLPVIAMICSIIGLAPEGIAIILGVNTFLDMCRTSLNVTGDLATAFGASLTWRIRSTDSSAPAGACHRAGERHDPAFGLHQCHREPHQVIRVVVAQRKALRRRPCLPATRWRSRKARQQAGNFLHRCHTEGQAAALAAVPGLAQVRTFAAFQAEIRAAAPSLLRPA